jgi:hypothetical protein
VSETCGRFGDWLTDVSEATSLIMLEDLKSEAPYTDPPVAFGV